MMRMDQWVVAGQKERKQEIGSPNKFKIGSLLMCMEIALWNFHFLFGSKQHPFLSYFRIVFEMVLWKIGPLCVLEWI